MAWILGGAALVVWWMGSAPAATAQSDPIGRGHDLFITGCSSCHGTDGRGVKTSAGAERGPSLVNAGSAGAYYQLSTGRMPLEDSTKQAQRKPPAYSADDIDALVAYVASLGPGPVAPEVNTRGSDLAVGGELFRANCAPCHSASGAGGALSYGQDAPSLHAATARQVGAAVRSGPGQMPTFGPDVLDGTEVDNVAGYVEFLRHPEDRGGLPIGRTGPVPEGFVAWTLGIGALLAAVGWIGTRAPARGSGS